MLALCCSGGKDSCFNLMHCAAEGHEIVALANLRPADKGTFSVNNFLSKLLLLFVVYCGCYSSFYFLCYDLFIFSFYIIGFQ